MIQKESIIRIVVDFDSERAPFSDFDDIAKMIAEFIERDFIVEGAMVKSTEAFVSAK